MRPCHVDDEETKMATFLQILGGMTVLDNFESVGVIDVADYYKIQVTTIRIIVMETVLWISTMVASSHRTSVWCNSSSMCLMQSTSQR